MGINECEQNGSSLLGPSYQNPLFFFLIPVLCSSLNMRVQFRLMELNRAVCLECPEYQIPWFHDRFCQQQYNKGVSFLWVSQIVKFNSKVNY